MGKSGKITFESQASPDGFWDASMLSILVDPIVITSQSGVLGSPNLSGRQKSHAFLDGQGTEWSWNWAPVDEVVKQTIMEAYDKADDGPLFVLPDSVGMSKGQASPNVFLANRGPDRRGGLVRFVTAPEASRDGRGANLWSVHAKFKTWGLRSLRRGQ